jgi:hypothetical protein
MSTDNLVKQIDRRLETVTNNITDLVLKITPLEEEKEALDNARKVLLGESLQAPKREYARLPDMAGYILDYIDSNPGQIGSAIGHGCKFMNTPAESGKVYKVLNSLCAEHKVTRDSSKKYWIRQHV